MNTKFIGFGNQKGGVGKSTLSEIIASILCYDYGYRLAVIDCDKGQHSFFKLRERERSRIENDAYLTNQIIERFRERKCTAYNVHQSGLSEGIALGRELSSKEVYDLIIYDLPGGGARQELLKFSLQLDYLIIPIEMDTQSLEASLAYASLVKDAGIAYDQSRIKEIYLLWNKVDRTVRQDILKEYNQRFSSSLHLETLRSMVYKSRRISTGIEDARGLSEVFRSTFISPRDTQLKPTGIKDIVDEIILLSGKVKKRHKKAPEPFYLCGSVFKKKK